MSRFGRNKKRALLLRAVTAERAARFMEFCHDHELSWDHHQRIELLERCLAALIDGADNRAHYASEPTGRTAALIEDIKQELEGKSTWRK